MPPKKRALVEGGGAGGDGSGCSEPLSPSPVLKKRCRSFDLEVKGCRHLQELVASCVQSVKVTLEDAVESAVTRATTRITEDVTKALKSYLSGSPSLCRTLVDQNKPPRYRLSFMNGLDSEVFTKNVIFATNGEPIRICMVVNDQQGSEETDLHRRILSAKIKVVVLDGDFNKHNQECWTSEEFKDYIVQPRDNVGSVLTGVSELRLKNGEAFLHGVVLNDISKFVRCGKFRLGVLVDDNLGERVLEGITEPFIVKDRRSEGSKKHDVPLLNDDVWRLKRISKEGVLHEALRGGGILYVQDFLRLYYKDEQTLRKILIKATKKVWTTIVEHAKKCDPGKELYSFIVQSNNATLFFNSVCQIVGAIFGGEYTPFNDLDNHSKDLVGRWSKVAYKNMIYNQPDYELDNGKPRPINQTTVPELSMLEHTFPDLMQGPNCEERRNICHTDGQQGTSNTDTRQCKLKRLGSLRVTQHDEDAFGFSFCLDPIPEQYCASTSEHNITGSVTLNCPTTAANEITGSVVLKQAPLTTDHEAYNSIPFPDNDASVPQFCEEHQPLEAHFGRSLSTIKALFDSPIYSRHNSFKDSDSHEALVLGAGTTV